MPVRRTLAFLDLAGLTAFAECLGDREAVGAFAQIREATSIVRMPFPSLGWPNKLAAAPACLVSMA
jgi:hypothetical protein